MRLPTASSLFGPRSGSKTRHFTIPDGLPPGALRALIPMRVIEVASMRPGVETPVTGEIDGAAERWREHIETDAARAGALRGRLAGARSPRSQRIYLGFWPDADGAVLADAASGS